MAEQSDIDLVKINVQESTFPQFTDEEIAALLDSYKSVSYVSYRLALLKASGTDVTLGPVKVSANRDFWNGLAALFLREYEAEQLQKQVDENGGSTVFMRRSDNQ